jgi:hypothetical protein
MTRLRIVAGSAMLVALGACTSESAPATRDATTGAIAPSAPSGQVRARTCRAPASPLPPIDTWPALVDVPARALSVERDVDADGHVDRVRAEYDDGSWSSGVDLTVVPADGGTTVVVRATWSFATLLSSVRVPDAVARSATLRAGVEDMLFERICTELDPSMRRLLARTGPLEWIAGEPDPPERYAVYVSDRAELARMLALVPFFEEEGGATPRSPPEGAWLVSAGARRPLRTLARRGASRLVATDHAVALVDEARAAHAWLYVWPHDGVKLRHRVVDSATFAGEPGHAVVRVRLGVAFSSTPCDVTIRLDDGTVSDPCGAALGTGG